MELGIDIGHVDHVIQVGSPREVSRLVQRVGRAGHQIGKISHGTIIASGFDDLAESLVITKKALAGDVEKTVPTYLAGDAIANQIAAMSVEYGEISIREITDILLKSAICLDAEPMIPTVIDQLSEHYILRRDGDKVITTGRARKYLSNNLSMIPDERKFPIYDHGPHDGQSDHLMNHLSSPICIPGLFLSPVVISGGSWRWKKAEDHGGACEEC